MARASALVYRLMRVYLKHRVDVVFGRNDNDDEGMERFIQHFIYQFQGVPLKGRTKCGIEIERETHALKHIHAVERISAHPIFLSKNKLSEVKRFPQNCRVLRICFRAEKNLFGVAHRMLLQVPITDLVPEPGRSRSLL